MGLFGPSWSWEEIQRKDAIMGDLKRENDRVLSELQNMNINAHNTGKVVYVENQVITFLKVLAIAFGIGFIVFIPSLLSQLVLLSERRPNSR